MKKLQIGKGKQRVVLASFLVGAVLLALTILFVREVKIQLWEQSVNTIMESTRQGCTTLKVQLQDAYDSMDTVKEYLEEFSPQQREELEMLLDSYSYVEKEAGLYLEDGSCLPETGPQDERVWEALSQTAEERGIINPHISSKTGVNVFGLFISLEMADGSDAWLTKEYEVDSIADTFSLSFYDNSGFSYVVDTQGDILIRAPHPNSNKTVRNLFDMLSADTNSASELEKIPSVAGKVLFRICGFPVSGGGHGILLYSAGAGV